MTEVKSNNKPKVKYRKDYQAPNFFIDAVDLHIDLAEDVTKIKSVLSVRSNTHNKASELVLDGRAQTLKKILLDGRLLSEKDYRLEDESLTIFSAPEGFTLEIDTETKPQENTSLMGLYKTDGNFCTQCESDGFRRITYYLDRPDVMALFTTTIVADKAKYPVLLSNGNLIEEGDAGEGRHFAKWHDPFKKPCYLFAMVAGDLAQIEDKFMTISGREVALKIFASHKAIGKCEHAMTSLKKSMKWDEEHYGREYDLDIFMIVAVNDFNFGAMENKGLNVFNDKYILVDSKTATDADYAAIDAVVSHEYFHNWSGNRVTLRDWFQLSLKEGLTVFRDHSFSETIGLAAVERINQVKRLRTSQFTEDSGPLAHAVRPDAYIEMNNFYTATVYEKGAEVIRMMRTLLGPENYRKGTDLYFERHDGQAVTCDDFAVAMEDASGVDLTQFKLWYSQSGTPVLTIKSDYNQGDQTYHLQIEQHCPSTPGQAAKQAYHIPIAVSLLDQKGNDLIETKILHLTKSQQTFTFDGVKEQPAPSLLRGFSAPVKLMYDYSDETLAFLMAHDSDPVARWEAGQRYMIRVVCHLIKCHQQNQALSLDSGFIAAVRQLLEKNNTDKALTAEMLQFPGEAYLTELMDVVDIDAIHQVRQFVKKAIAEQFEDLFMKIYQNNCTTQAYEYEIGQVANRSLKNICLSYLMMVDDEAVHALCHQQYQTADNMTDQLFALNLLATTDCEQRQTSLDHFYKQWQDEPLVIDKWFMTQALSYLPGGIERMRELIKHPAFNLKNPNKVRALVSVFSRSNLSQFHLASGEGYDFLTEIISQVDEFNPMVSSRLVEPFTRWRVYDKARGVKMQAKLEWLMAKKNLSKDLYEIVSKSLA